MLHHAKVLWRAIHHDGELDLAARDLWPPLKRRSLAMLMDARINLIPLNPTRGVAGIQSKSGHEFQKILIAAGFPCTFRQRRGSDVAVGCGMLKAQKLLCTALA